MLTYSKFPSKRRKYLVAPVLLVAVGLLPAGQVGAAAGGLDPTFNAGGIGANGPVNEIAFGEDGTIYIAGDFTEYNGISVGRVAALDADGNLETSFNDNVGAGADGSIEAMDIDAQGRIYLSGFFNNFDGEAREGIVRLASDGTLDATFIAPRFVNSNLPNNAVRSRVLEEHEGNVFIAGSWDTHDPAGAADYANPVVTLDGDTGALDANGITLYTQEGFQPVAPSGIEIAPDGDIVVHGRFAGPRTGIVKLNPDGTFDETFLFSPDVAENTGANNTVTDVAFVGDTVLAVGNFSTFHGDSAAAGIVRLLANGSIDPSFDSPVDVGMPVTTLAVDAAGRIYLAGSLDPDLFGSKSFGRLLPDGAPDPSFPATSAPLVEVAVSPDGELFAFGAFTTFGDATARNIERIVTNDAPALPTGFSVRPEGSDLVATWTVPTENAPDSYLVEATPATAAMNRSGDIAFAAQAGTVSCSVPHPQATCTLTGLAPETFYSVRMSSVRGDEVVTSESAISFFSGAAPTNPTNPTRPTNPDGGTLPATGSGLTILVLAAGFSLVGWRLARSARSA